MEPQVNAGVSVLACTDTQATLILKQVMLCTLCFCLCHNHKKSIELPKNKKQTSIYTICQNKIKKSAQA
jgi:hypothetical protein